MCVYVYVFARCNLGKMWLITLCAILLEKNSFFQAVNFFLCAFCFVHHWFIMMINDKIFAVHCVVFFFVFFFVGCAKIPRTVIDTGRIFFFEIFKSKKNRVNQKKNIVKQVSSNFLFFFVEKKPVCVRVCVNYYFL